MTGEALGYLLQQLIQQKGVLDAYYTSVMMKKNRPGNLLSVLVQANDLIKLEEYLLIHSSSFGVRSYPVLRNILERKFIFRESPWGLMQFKVGYLEGKVIKVTPEYEDVVKLAKASQKSFLEVYQWALAYGGKIKEEGGIRNDG